MVNDRVERLMIWYGFTQAQAEEIDKSTKREEFFRRFIFWVVFLSIIAFVVWIIA